MLLRGLNELTTGAPGVDAGTTQSSRVVSEKGKQSTWGRTGEVTQGDGEGVQSAGLWLVVPEVKWSLKRWTWGSGTREALQTGPQAGPMPAAGTGTVEQGGALGGRTGYRPHSLAPARDFRPAARLGGEWGAHAGGAAGVLISARHDLQPCRGCMGPAPYPPLLSQAPPIPPTCRSPPAQDHPQDLVCGLPSEGCSSSGSWQHCGDWPSSSRTREPSCHTAPLPRS